MEEALSRVSAHGAPPDKFSRSLTQWHEGELMEVRIVLYGSLDTSSDVIAAAMASEALRATAITAFDGIALTSVEHRPGHTVLSLSYLSSDHSKILTILRELRATGFTGSESYLRAGQEKYRLMGESAQRSPMQFARGSFLRLAYPLGHPCAGEVSAASLGYNEPSLDQISNAFLIDGIGFSSVGPIADESLADVLDIKTGHCDFDGSNMARNHKPPETIAPVIRKADHPGATQDLLRIGCATSVLRSEADYAPLQVGVLALGGFPISRLTKRLRERDGIAYAPRALMDPSRQGSTFVIEADVTAGKGLYAVEAIKEELQETLRDSESLAIATDYAVGQMSIATSSQSGLASSLATLIALRTPLSWLTGYGARLASVNQSDVASAVNFHLADNKWAGVLVSPKSS